MNLDDTLLNLSESEDEDTKYTYDKIELTVGFGDGFVDDCAEYVSAAYRIIPEYRSYGIKDIDVSIIDDIEIEYTVSTPDSSGKLVRTTKDVVITPDVLTYSWVSGSGVVPQALNVRLDNDGVVIEAEIEFSYWNPE